MRRLMCAMISTCFFYKEHKNETKCLKCGKLRFVEVINECTHLIVRHGRL
jgi:hypothetical protein